MPPFEKGTAQATSEESSLGKGRESFILAVAVFWLLFIGAIAVLVYSFLIGNYLLLVIPAVFFGIVLYMTVIIRRDAAYVPTPESIVRRMLEMAEVKPGETLYDLGSGDGRIVIVAARDFGAKAIGVEVDKRLISVSQRSIKAANLEDKAQIVKGNFYETDLSDADVVTLYLRQNTNDRLGAKFKKELRPGTRIVSYTFVMTGWQPTKVDSESHVYMYTI